MTPNFEEILLELSYRVPTGIVDLTNEEHLDELVIILEENRIYNSQAINALREKAKSKPKAPAKKVLNKIKPKSASNPKAGESPKFKGYFHRGHGYYSKQPGGEITHKSDGGSLRVLNAKEKAEKNKGVKQQTKKQSNLYGKGKGGKLSAADYKQPAEEPKSSKSTPTTKGGKFSDVVDGLGNIRNKEKNFQNTVQAQKSILDTLSVLANKKGNPHAADHKQVAEIVKKIFNGEKLSSSEKKLASQYIRVAEPTELSPNETKFYIAQQPGNWKNQGSTARIRIYVGSKGASNPVYGAFGKFVRDNGMTELSPSTFGGKLSTANQTYVDKDNKTRILKGVSSVQKSKDGIVQSVKMGDLKIVRVDPKTAKTNTQRKEIERNNRTLEEYAEKIEAKDLDFIDMDKGVMPDSPENRVVVIKEAISGMAVRLKGLADKALITDEETLTLINRLGNFSKKDPNNNPEQWSREFEEILSDIANHQGEPSLKEAWANYCEVFIAIREMHDNGKGTQNGKCALLPQSTTLETVDVITVSNGKGENRIVTLDGISVKKGVGGASGLPSKARKSTYKNDPKGLIKKGIIELSESHGKPFELKLDRPLKEHKKLNEDYQTYLKKKASELNVSPEFIKQIENELKKGGKGYKKVMSALAKTILEREKAGLDVSTNVVEALKLRLESRYIYTELSHEAYNTNVDVQDFSNDSILSQKEDRGGAKLVKERRIFVDSSDGINILAYVKPEFNIGFDLEGRSRNPGAGRMHNAPKRQ